MRLLEAVHKSSLIPARRHWSPTARCGDLHFNKRRNVRRGAINKRATATFWVMCAAGADLQAAKVFQIQTQKARRQSFSRLNFDPPATFSLAAKNRKYSVRRFCGPKLKSRSQGAEKLEEKDCDVCRGE